MRAWVPFLLSLLLAACAPTETGNPSLTTGMTLSAYSSDSNRIALGTEPGATSIDRIWLSVASIELDSCDAQPSETAVAGPFFENLVSRPRPARDLVTDFDRFCGVVVRTIAATNDLEAVPDELVGQTIVVHGQRGDTVPFLISSAHASNLGLHVPAGAPIAAEPRRFLVAFDAAQLLSSLDLSTAIVGSDGTIRIDATNNSTLLSSFEAGVGGSVSLHHDLDRDGELDPDESARIDH